MQAGGSSLKGIPSQGCTPLRPSYVTDLRGHTLKGNTTLAPADNNTTRKVLQISAAPFSKQGYVSPPSHVLRMYSASLLQAIRLAATCGA